MTHLVHCSCGEVIVKSLGPDTKVRAKVLVFKNDTAYAVCKSCDTEVEVPLQLNTEMLKSMSAPEKSRNVPLYIRTPRR